MNEEMVLFTAPSAIASERFKALMCAEKKCENTSTHFVLALLDKGNGMGFSFPLCADHATEFEADQKAKRCS